jgi:hypothetical protein
MKKIIISLACGAVLFCGCNKQTSDSAKIEALSQKLDAVLTNESITISNEFVLFNAVSALKNQVTNLASVDEVNNLDYYYHTNLVNLAGFEEKAIESSFEAKIDSEASIQFAAMSGLFERQCDLILTNIAAIPELAVPAENHLDKIDSFDWELMQGDVFDMNTKVDDMQEDLIKIKTRLGIAY